MEVNSWLSKHSRSHTSVPQDLRDSMSRTVAYALDFVLDTLDFSPEDAQYPRTEADLRRQPTADPIPNDVHAVILWNDDKHSYDEIVQHLKSTIDASEEQATASAQQLEVEVRSFINVYGAV
jgi:E3 ubiquitin-protein ligase UBR1